MAYFKYEKEKKQSGTFGSNSTPKNAIGDVCFGCRILPYSRCWQRSIGRHWVILTTKMR